MQRQAEMHRLGRPVKTQKTGQQAHFHKQPLQNNEPHSCCRGLARLDYAADLTPTTSAPRRQAGLGVNAANEKDC